MHLRDVILSKFLDMFINQCQPLHNIVVYSSRYRLLWTVWQLGHIGIGMSVPNVFLNWSIEMVLTIFIDVYVLYCYIYTMHHGLNILIIFKPCYTLQLSILRNIDFEISS